MLSNVAVCKPAFNWDGLSVLADKHCKCGILQAADVYAFGVLLWEMLTSSRAWAGLRHVHIICMVGVQKQTLATPQGLPPTLETLLTHCLAQNPETRPSFKAITDTLSHYVQVTRGGDAAELWGQGTLTPIERDRCFCFQAKAKDCCTTCSHTSVCVEASCFRCHFASAALPPASPEKHTANTPMDSAADNSQVSKQSPCWSAVSSLVMEAATAPAKADQAKQSCSSTSSPGGKGKKRTLLSM